MRNPILALTVSALILGAPLAALAQERDPAGRQTLVDMAYVLGEAHALRQACQGANDQYWRTRMMQLVETEQADAGLTQRLKEAFNTGFVAREGAYPACAAGARKAMTKVLARGKVLAARLARTAPPAAPPGAESTQTGDMGSRPR
jgi:uncharacterized protein (TIGR02301 family)